jgi:hypothetical protein
MRADELRQFLIRRPFEPIRLHVNSGEQVESFEKSRRPVSNLLS